MVIKGLVNSIDSNSVILIQFFHFDTALKILFMSSFLPPIFNSNIRYSKAIDILRRHFQFEKPFMFQLLSSNAEKKYVCVMCVCETICVWFFSVKIEIILNLKLFTLQWGF